MGTCFHCLLLLINFPSQLISIWLNLWLFLKEWVWLTETALNPCPTSKCSAEWGRTTKFVSSKCEAKSKTQWENLLYILNTEGCKKKKKFQRKCMRIWKSINHRLRKCLYGIQNVCIHHTFMLLSQTNTLNYWP